MKPAPILKYPGAKWSIADWILEFIPEHDVYLEPFFGSGAVFFNKRPVRIETINDIDGDVVNLFRVIRTRAEELAAPRDTGGVGEVIETVQKWGRYCARHRGAIYADKI